MVAANSQGSKPPSVDLGNQANLRNIPVCKSYNAVLVNRGKTGWPRMRDLHFFPAETQFLMNYAAAADIGTLCATQQIDFMCDPVGPQDRPQRLEGQTEYPLHDELP
jgi:hypothetical protein